MLVAGRDADSSSPPPSLPSQLGREQAGAVESAPGSEEPGSRRRNREGRSGCLFMAFPNFFAPACRFDGWDQDPVGQGRERERAQVVSPRSGFRPKTCCQWSDLWNCCGGSDPGQGALLSLFVTAATSFTGQKLWLSCCPLAKKCIRVLFVVTKNEDIHIYCASASRV